ncbi:hypothetical protein AWJ20_1058 [Sugiyamaella lignohabitans]|uniref:Uncharacterized protein n=1 Tax=Sugiyamaella lignohabitans TaxID=796027 RepID=A0A161HL93_9ASCO|nr:uncharacterized protein AWJ20_1058 [Sugiyamaella lignohabitans]ANB12788.1 hypothetical protein AWJ20_1058 [Sugiyamaella lignohabitans]
MLKVPTEEDLRRVAESSDDSARSSLERGRRQLEDGGRARNVGVGGRGGGGDRELAQFNLGGGNRTSLSQSPSASPGRRRGDESPPEEQINFDTGRAVRSSSRNPLEVDSGYQTGGGSGQMGSKSGIKSSFVNLRSLLRSEGGPRTTVATAAAIPGSTGGVISGATGGATGSASRGSGDSSRVGAVSGGASEGRELGVEDPRSSLESADSVRTGESVFSGYSHVHGHGNGGKDRTHSQVGITKLQNKAHNLVQSLALNSERPLYYGHRRVSRAQDMDARAAAAAAAAAAGGAGGGPAYRGSIGNGMTASLSRSSADLFRRSSQRFGSGAGGVDTSRPGEPQLTPDLEEHLLLLSALDRMPTDFAQCEDDLDHDPERLRKLSLFYGVDTVVENQRGWFFMGYPFFSDKSLFPLDPHNWTTGQGRALNGGMNDYSLPDFTWEWLWKRWYVDMSGDVDDQGWKYSWRFRSRNWHGTHVWFRSFVRKRTWKRIRRKVDSYIPPASRIHSYLGANASDSAEILIGDIPLAGAPTSTDATSSSATATATATVTAGSDAAVSPPTSATAGTGTGIGIGTAGSDTSRDPSRRSPEPITGVYNISGGTSILRPVTPIISLSVDGPSHSSHDLPRPGSPEMPTIQESETKVDRLINSMNDSRIDRERINKFVDFALDQDNDPATIGELLTRLHGILQTLQYHASRQHIIRRLEASTENAPYNETTQKLISAIEEDHDNYDHKSSPYGHLRLDSPSPSPSPSLSSSPPSRPNHPTSSFHQNR